MPDLAILVVEDENIVAVDIRDRLEQMGYRVVGHAASGEEAIRKAGEASPDLVLMDIMLKGEMDGIEAARQITLLYNIPVVYLTAYADAMTLEKAKITEPYGYILKPFEEREILTAIEMAVHRHKMRTRLKASRRWFSTVLDSIGDAVIAADMEGLVTFMNPIAEELTGWSREGAIGRDLAEVFNIIDGETRAPFECLASRVVRNSGALGKGRYLLLAGEEREVPVECRVSHIKDDKDNVAGVVLVVRDIAEREQAEKDVRQAKERAELIYRVTPSAIFTVDTECRITSWNDKAREITGYPAGEVIGRECRLFSREPCDEKCTLFRDGAEIPAGGMACFIQRKDGQRRMVSKNLDYLRDSDGNIIGGIESFEDVTERRRAEAELQESEMKFRSVVQSASDAIVLSDGEGKIIAWNKGGQEIFGYEQDEVSGRSVGILVPERMREFHLKGLPVLAGMDSSGATGKPIELVGVRKSGEEFPIELTLSTWRTGSEVFHTRIIRDISVRKRAAEQLENTLSELNIILENATVGILFIKGGIVSWVNRKMEEILGYGRREIEGKPPKIFYSSGEDYERMAEEASHVLAGGGTYSSERLLRHRDGSVFWCCFIGRAIDPSERSRGAIWIVEDIAERKNTEKELLAAKEAAEAANRAKSEFLANMSHEIRTPLNGVIGMTELALSTALTPEQREYLRTVKDSTDTLLDIVNDILDFSKIDAGRLELEAIGFNLHRVVGNVIRPMSIIAQKKRFRISCEVGRDVPAHLVGDPSRLRQVLFNLVGNAIKFTEEGEVALRVETVPSGEPGASAPGGDVRLHFSVSDTGIGIPVDKLGNIFQSFTQADGSTTRKYGGTGLGLTISKRIVDIMGGEMWVESETGRGSTFHFAAVFGHGRPQRAGAPLERMDFDGMRAMIVEESGEERSGIGELLASLKFTVSEAGSGEEALDLTKNSEPPFDLLVLGSIAYGEGVLGLAEKLRAAPRTRETGIIVLAREGGGEEEARLREAGVRGYLSKPVDNDRLVKAVAKVLERPGERELRAGKPTSLNVLLAEDNPTNRKLAETIIKQGGHRVTTVQNGREAIDALMKSRFDVVVMDIQMPEIDGVEATRIIRSSKYLGFDRNIPIIALTAYAMGKDREYFMKAGMNGYVSKPYKSAELLESIQRFGPVSRTGPEGRGEGTPARRNESGVIYTDEALERMGGDRELLLEIWEAFVGEAPMAMAALEAALEAALVSGDYGTLLREAHSLKSSSASIGAYLLGEEAARLEQAAKENDMDTARVVCGNLMAEFGKVLGALLGHIRDYSS